MLNFKILDTNSHFPISYAALLNRILIKKGLNRDDILDQTEIINMAGFDSESTINANEFLTIIINAINKINEEDLGLALGENTNIIGHGDLGELLIYCKNLEHLIIGHW